MCDHYALKKYEFMGKSKVERENHFGIADCQGWSRLGPRLEMRTSEA